MKDRFLLVSPDFPPPLIGGSLVYIKTLVEHSNYPIEVLTTDNLDNDPEVIGHPHKILRKKLIIGSNEPSNGKLLISYLYMLMWVSIQMLLRRYKLVIANPGAIGNSLLFLLGKIFRVKVIGIAYAEELTIPLKRNDIKSIIKRSFVKIAYKRAHGFIVVCHFCKNILKDELGVDKEKIDVIPSCLTLEKFGSKREKELKNRNNNITSVGRLIKRKGFHYLIKSVAELRKEIKDVSLKIVGSGPMSELLEKQIKDLNASSYIHLLNQIDDVTLSNIYSETDLFVLANYQLSNGDTEGCPSVFSEAMAHGIPIIGGTGAGVDTAIIDGQNGLIVNSENELDLLNAMKEILTNEAQFKSMSANAKKKLLRDHHPDAIGKAFNKSIYRFLSNKKADAAQARFNKEIPSL